MCFCIYFFLTKWKLQNPTNDKKKLSSTQLHKYRTAAGNQSQTTTKSWNFTKTFKLYFSIRSKMMWIKGGGRNIPKYLALLEFSVFIN